MNPTQEENKFGNKGVIFGILALILVALGVFAFTRNSGDTQKQNQVPTTPTNNTNTPTETPTNTPAIINSKYKDGTYSAEGNYQSPGGAESIQVTLVLKNDIITAATTVSNATRPNSVTFQGLFISGFKQYVIGKNISEVNLTKVSGSSLTPKGFNDAVAEIKIQAEA